MLSDHQAGFDYGCCTRACNRHPPKRMHNYPCANCSGAAGVTCSLQPLRSHAKHDSGTPRPHTPARDPDGNNRFGLLSKRCCKPCHPRAVGACVRRRACRRRLSRTHALILDALQDATNLFRQLRPSLPGPLPVDELVPVLVGGIYTRVYLTFSTGVPTSDPSRSTSCPTSPS